jgi:hypothetical protein
MSCQRKINQLKEPISLIHAHHEKQVGTNWRWDWKPCPHKWAKRKQTQVQVLNLKLKRFASNVLFTIHTF